MPLETISTALQLTFTNIARINNTATQSREGIGAMSNSMTNPIFYTHSGNKPRECRVHALGY